MTVLLLVSAVLIMASMAQTTFAADSNITMTFKPIKAISPQTLAELNDTEWVWRPTFSIGDALIITENGQVTKYFYDDADYKGVSEVRGFFDDDGNASKPFLLPQKSPGKYNIRRIILNLGAKLWQYLKT